MTWEIITRDQSDIVPESGQDKDACGSADLDTCGNMQTIFLVAMRWT